MAAKGFFESFFGEFAFDKWTYIFDWLVDDGKFNDWTKTELKLFADGVKKIKTIEKGLYLYDKKSVANPSAYDRKKNRRKTSIVIMVKGNGQAKDIVRHLRNGVAHGRATLCTRNSVRCIELTDFGKYGEKNKSGGQTAYILVPVGFIKDLYDLYVKTKP